MDNMVELALNSCCAKPLIDNSHSLIATQELFATSCLHEIRFTGLDSLKKHEMTKIILIHSDK